MNILFLRGFNNYFNRVIKKYSTLDDYRNESSSYIDLANINFNPNDGVATELIVGNESQQENSAPLDWENIGTPDYCVCYEHTLENEEGFIIFSRWYVLESERTRTGQYRLALKRDVVAEHFDVIKSSPCFIEKGMVNETDNSLLYNKESMTYNQIKSNEIPLKDSTGSGWIVGYVPKNLPQAGSLVNMTTTILMEGSPSSYYEPNDLPFNISTSASTYAYDYSLNQLYIPFNAFGADYTSYSGNYWGYEKFKYVAMYKNNEFSIYSNAGSPGTTTQINNSYKNSSATDLIPFVNSSDTYSKAASTKGGGGLWFSGNTDIPFTVTTPDVTSAASTNMLVFTRSIRISPLPSLPNMVGISRSNSAITYYNTLVSAVRSYWNNFTGSTVDNLISTYNGAYVKLNNKFYRMTMDLHEYKLMRFYSSSVTPTNYSSTGKTTFNNLNVTYSATSTGFNNTNVNNLLRNSIVAGSTAGTVAWNTARSYLAEGGIFLLVPRYKISLTQISTETLTLADRAYTDRNHTYDNSADLFAIPYGEIKFANDGTEFTTSPSRSLGMARAIASRYSSNCYDLQLVPYCPSRALVDALAWYVEADEAYELTALDSKIYQIFTNENDDDVGVVFWPSSSKGTFDINLNLPVDVGQGSSALVHKITNETEVCRLASPNFSGQFEFSIAKNNGVTKFNVDYTYKPYSPYIHLNPDFKFIYGQDWDDARGLICGGDFSLNHITPYWQDYMNNNKNFQQIFDRQIQNMDVNNAIALEKQEFQATVGTITSAIGGAMGGAAAGATAGAAAGPWGALIGGVVGAVGGGVGSGLASAYGAEKDRDWLTRQQQEARSYAIDMYGYQLGNIQAMPYSIKGTDALTNNNKIWPIVEIYKATDLEVQLLTSKIRYNGMTIMAVGNIADYCTSEDFDKVFIKGQIIRLESDEINDDFHIADAIYQEINKGVYIPSGGL